MGDIEYYTWADNIHYMVLLNSLIAIRDFYYMYNPNKINNLNRVIGQYGYPNLLKWDNSIIDDIKFKLSSNIDLKYTFEQDFTRLIIQFTGGKCIVS